MGNRLFVGNLSWNVDDNGLRAAFEKYGEVTNCRVITDRESGRSRGFGFVTFADEADTESAKEMDGTEIDGRSIRVDSAHDKRPGGGGGDRQDQRRQDDNRDDNWEDNRDDNRGGNHW